MFDPAEQDRVLKEFLAERVRPYDPETDDYDRPPFAADIKEGKNDPIYNAHSYHTKVPPRSIIPYILHYTQPGDLVLDPFCGSGMTGVAAQMCAKPPADILEQFPELKDRLGSRVCILNDLSPAACHIAYNYNTPVDVEALRCEFERIKAAVKDEFDWLYGTEHYEPAVGIYDPGNAEVVDRLKNPPTVTTATSGRGQMVLEGHASYGTKDWELLTKAEVETRLGYPVTDLPHDDKWGAIDVAKVKQWVCIPATIQYTIWSDVFRCEGFVTIEEPTGKFSKRGKNAGKPIIRKKRVHRGCREQIILWDAAVDHSTQTVLDEVTCPHCQRKWSKRSLSLIGAVPVVQCYAHRTMDGYNRKTRKTTYLEAARLRDIADRSVPYWFPDGPIDTGREMMRHGLLKRGIKQFSEFYTKRNLWGLARIWDEAKTAPTERLSELVKFTVTSMILSAAEINRHGFGRQATRMSGTLYIASFREEANVLRLLDGKEVSIPEAFKMLQARAEGTSAGQAVCVLMGSAVQLALPDSSIDYIFADPPFGSNIFYADCSMLWEAWLNQFTDEIQEMVINDRRKNGPFKKLDDYARLMGCAFKEMFRVLKPGRWATVEFNNSDGRVFEALKNAAVEAGFEIVNMLLLDKKQKTFKQVQGAKGEAEVVDKDVVFNLHKPAMLRANVQAEDHDLEDQVAEAVRQHLQTLPGRINADPAKYNDEHRTTATINSMLMNTLIPRGVGVERLNLPFIQRACARYFRKVGQHWYLRGEAVGVNGVGLLQEEVAVKDEVTAIAWLRQKLESRPALIGELKPLWMRATGLLPASISQSFILEDLLISNFWRDEGTNRWREPTLAERERMNDDKTIRVLHDAERYVGGSLRRQTTDPERCEWIDALFQMCRALEENDSHVLPSIRDLAPDEGYRLIGRLFQGVLKDRIPQDVYSRAEKQARVASQRIVRNVQGKAEKAKAKRRKEEGPGLFDL